MARRVAIGRQALNTDILNATSNGQPVVVAGESLGAMVIDREEAYLATDPSAPSPDQLSFIEFSNPERGLADTESLLCSAQTGCLTCDAGLFCSELAADVCDLKLDVS